MTPFEIALAIRNKPESESENDFVLRTMSGERVRDLITAGDLLKGWDRADEYFEKILAILQPVGRKTPNATIAELIEHTRGLGYDPALETLLARRWRCPHCKQFATIEKIELDLGDPTSLQRCGVCGEEGIIPVDPKARLDVRDGGTS